MRIALFALLFSVFSVSAQANYDLSNVVLGIDYLAYDKDSSYLFPCIAESDVMFCDEFVRMEDDACTDSLKIKIRDEKTISCTLSTGEEVVLAQTKPNAEIRSDSTQPAGFYPLDVSSRVSIKQEGPISILVVK